MLNVGVLVYRDVSMSNLWQMRAMRRITMNQQFSDDVLINSSLKQGDWRRLHTEDITFGELKDLITETFALDNNTSNRLVFVCKQYIGANGNKKVITMSEEKTVENTTIHTDCNPQMPRTQIELTSLEQR